MRLGERRSDLPLSEEGGGEPTARDRQIGIGGEGLAEPLFRLLGIAVVVSPARRRARELEAERPRSLSLRGRECRGPSVLVVYAPRSLRRRAPAPRAIRPDPSSTRVPGSGTPVGPSSVPGSVKPVAIVTNGPVSDCDRWSAK